MSILKLKEEFIDKLTRLKRAMDYMDSPASVEDKEKWQSKFTEILAEVNDLEYQLRQSGCVMSDEEIHRLIENL